MSNRRFEVIFRGDVVPGQSLLDVKQRLAELFGAPPARIEQMFSGRPVVIKRDLSEEAAARYRAALKEAGALVDVRPIEPAEEAGNNISRAVGRVPVAADVTDDADNVSGRQTVATQSGSESPKAEETISVAPVGADVLLSEYRKDFTPKDVDTSHMAVEAPGADVLKDDEKSPPVERNVDTTHLSVKDPD